MEHHRDPVGDLGQFIEILARHQHGRARCGEIEQRLPDHGSGARVHAPGRLAHHQNSGVAQYFAADDELLQVSAGQACRFGIALCLAYIERLGGAVDRRQGRCGVDETMLDHAARGVPRQKRVFGKFHARGGAVTEPLFGHESRAKLAPLRDGQMSRRFTVDHHRAGVLRQPLAGKCGEQLILPITGDAGDAQDFTTLQFERNMREPDAVRIVGLEAEIVDDEARHRGAPAHGGFDFLDVGADHHARERGRGFRLRVAGRDLLAAAQDRGGVA